MGSTYLSLHYHLVFSTKERFPFIGSTWRPQCHGYLGGAVSGLGGIAEAMGGVDDHVHLLVGLRATNRLADFLCELKKASSVWAIENHDRRFRWQEGYAAFTVSDDDRDPVRSYILTQEEHHRRVSFVDELKKLLSEHRVAYDAKYLE